MIVYAPDPEYTGEVAGVAFLNGKGRVDPSNRAALAYFSRRGYTVSEEKAPVAPVEEPVEVKRPAGNAPRAEWVTYAINQGLSEEDVAKANVKELQELTKEEES